ncbi:MAG: chemotaxis protein CheB [Polyangiaceae bacterium]|nr:chemotaxis protein CheB [Polyangiaceae bacterium]
MNAKIEILVVGASWGGLVALQRLFRGLKRPLPYAIALVQHRGRDSGEALVDALGAACVMPVVEIEDKTPLAPGQVFLAPADYHALVEPGGFELSIDEPVSFSRPSIDVLFESAADAYGPRCAGLVLTGANQDGVRGMTRIKRLGGPTLAQDPHEAESPVLPGAAIASGSVDRVLSIEDLAVALSGLGRA